MHSIHFLSKSLPAALFSNVQESAQNMGSHIVSKLNPRKILKASAVVGVAFTALEMLGSVPAANAGFLCFSACMSICLGTSVGTAGGFAPLCTATCIGICSTNPV